MRVWSALRDRSQNPDRGHARRAAGKPFSNRELCYDAKFTDNVYPFDIGEFDKLFRYVARCTRDVTDTKFLGLAEASGRSSSSLTIVANCCPFASTNALGLLLHTEFLRDSYPDCPLGGFFSGRWPRSPYRWRAQLPIADPRGTLRSRCSFPHFPLLKEVALCPNAPSYRLPRSKRRFPYRTFSTFWVY